MVVPYRETDFTLLIPTCPARYRSLILALALSRVSIGEGIRQLSLAYPGTRTWWRLEVTRTFTVSRCPQCGRAYTGRSYANRS